MTSHTRVAVELARLAHAPLIARMSRDHIEHGLGWSWTEARVRRAIEQPDTNVAVVRDGERVMAFGIMRYGPRQAHLHLLAVQPECRRTGLATAVVGWLEDVARAAGCVRVVVECRRSNDAARHLYHELGFHERHLVTRMYRGREDGIRLEKRLGPAGEPPHAD